jgi:hypothetical protein
MKLVRLSFLSILLATACEEKSDLPFSSEETGLLVVEGVLTNENKNHLVSLSLPYLRQNGAPRPAAGAAVWIAEDSTIVMLSEFPQGSGKYYTPARRAVSGKAYTLFIRYNEKEYSAQDSPVPVQPLQDLRYKETADGYSLTLDPTGQDPYYIEHTITWENTSACVPGLSCDGKIVFYDLKTIDVNEIFKPDKEPFYFPPQSLVIRKKYSVSARYRTFLRSMLSETEWRGGVFDVQRSDVTTNLSEGAVGFFAVCSVVSDTTVVE